MMEINNIIIMITMLKRMKNISIVKGRIIPGNYFIFCGEIWSILSDWQTALQLGVLKRGTASLPSTRVADPGPDHRSEPTLEK